MNATPKIIQYPKPKQMPFPLISQLRLFRSSTTGSALLLCCFLWLAGTTLPCSAQDLTDKTYSFPIYKNNCLQEFLNIDCIGKVGQDSFLYRITVKDGHFNKTAQLEFKEFCLTPMAVAKGDSVTCIAYLRTPRSAARSENIIRKTGNLLLQIIDGRNAHKFSIINDVKISIVQGEWALRNPICLRFIPELGFVYAYGDGAPAEGMLRKNGLCLLSRLNDQAGLVNQEGTILWRKTIPCGYSTNLRVRADKQNIWLLRTANAGTFPEWEELMQLSAENGTLIDSQIIRGAADEEMQSLCFDLDDIGRPYVAGVILDDYRSGIAFANVSGKTIVRTSDRIALRALFRGSFKGLYSYCWDNKQVHQSVYRFTSNSYPNQRLRYDSRGNYFVPCFAFKDSSDVTHFWGPVLKEQHTAVLYSDAQASFTLNGHNELSKGAEYPTDTVAFVFLNSPFQNAKPLFARYCSIPGRPFVCMSDQSIYHLFDYNKGQTLLRINRSKKEILRRRFYWTGEGKIAAWECNEDGLETVLEWPVP